MSALHGGGVTGVKRILVLIDHDAAGSQRIKTVAVKFLREKSFARAERIRRVDDNQVIFIME